MILCKTCQHRTGANSCAHRLETLGGIHWCDMIAECSDHLPRDRTAYHVSQLQAIPLSAQRVAYLDRIARDESPDARQRAADAFRAWWSSTTPEQRRTVVEMASFGDPKNRLRS